MSDPRSMFYGANSKIFELAKENRKNLTVAEKTLWEKLRRNQLGVKIRSQHPIGKYIADFYCHRNKLVIELDGEYHDKKDQKYLDQIRTETMENFGIQMLRFNNDDVFDNIEKILNEINHYIKRSDSL